MRRITAALGLSLAVLVGCAASDAGALQRARLLVHKGREKEAIELLRGHLSSHPEAIDERRLLIRIIALTGDLGAAEREATALAERLGPNEPTPWIEMGYALELAHRYEDALGMYDRASDVAPKNPAGARAGGMRAAQWGEAELAEPRLAESLRRDPKDAKVWHALGLARLKLRDLKGAKQAYASGLVAAPASLDNRLGLATVAVAEGDAAGALEQYDLLARARPKLGDVQLGRAWALMKLGRLDDAEVAIGKAESSGGSPAAIRAQKHLLARLRATAEPQRIR